MNINDFPLEIQRVMPIISNKVWMSYTTIINSYRVKEKLRVHILQTHEVSWIMFLTKNKNKLSSTRVNIVTYTQ